jgi:hypothetical protein
MKTKCTFVVLCVIAILLGIFVAKRLFWRRDKFGGPDQGDRHGGKGNPNEVRQGPNELRERANTKASTSNKTANAETGKLTEELIDWTMRDLEQVRYENMLRDPARFASLARKHEMMYTEANKNFGPEDLPKIYSLLKEDKHKNEWRFIAQLIGFVSDRGDTNSIDVLVDYLQREDVWPEVKESRTKSYDVGMGKILCLEWIGMIGGEHAEEILLKAIEPEGAEEVAKKWLPFTEVSFPGGSGGRKGAIDNIRGRAAMGLVFCQSAKGDEILERIYQEEKEKCIQNGVEFSEIFHQIVSAMAHKTFVEERGLRKRFELYGSEEYSEVISPYIRRYWLKKM